MQSSNKTERFGKQNLPNCETEFLGLGNARRITQTFSDVIVLENWLYDQRGIVRINGRIIRRFENVTVRKWNRMVRLIDRIAPVVRWSVCLLNAGKKPLPESRAAMCNK